ncbi:MAG: peptidase E [Planctomycetota bacterium]
MHTHILAIGGGGYCGPNGGPSPIMRYFLALTRKKFPKICFIPTAAADSPESIHTFIHAMNGMGAHPNYLQLYHLPTTDLESFVMDFDAVYVSGGHTKNMLALWREWGLDRILVNAWQKGVVVGGASAGAICWFKQGCTDSITDAFDPLLNGLGMVKGSFGPHYGHPRGRWRTAYMDMVRTGQLAGGYGVTDRAALHYIDGKLAHLIAESADAAVYRLKREKNGKVSEHPEKLELLGP